MKPQVIPTQYILRYSRIIHKYGKSLIDKYGISEQKHSDNMAPNANSEEARGRLEVSSMGKSRYRNKGR
jgi:hypothetical protein